MVSSSLAMMANILLVLLAFHLPSVYSLETVDDAAISKLLVDYCQEFSASDACEDSETSAGHYCSKGEIINLCVNQDGRVHRGQESFHEEVNETDGSAVETACYYFPQLASSPQYGSFCSTLELCSEQVAQETGTTLCGFNVTVNDQECQSSLVSCPRGSVNAGKTRAVVDCTAIDSDLLWDDCHVVASRNDGAGYARQFLSFLLSDPTPTPTLTFGKDGSVNSGGAYGSIRTAIATTTVLWWIPKLFWGWL